MEIFQSFGLDLKLLIANLLNFVILVAILYKLGYKPILKFIKARQEKIEQGLKDAERANKKLGDATSEKEKTLAGAHKEAQLILGKAREQAQVQSNALLTRAKQETKTIVEKAKKEIQQERENALTQVRHQAASLVVAVTEKLLHKKVDPEEDKLFIEKSLQEIK